MLESANYEVVAALGGQNEHFRPRLPLLELPQDIQPVQVRQAEVKNQNIGRRGFHFVYDLQAVANIRYDLVSLRLDNPPEAIPDDLMILSNDDACHGKFFAGCLGPTAECPPGR